MRMRSLSFCLLLAAAKASPAWALSAAESKIYSPLVERGEKELEWRSFASGKGPVHEQGHAVSIGYAPTAYWEPEIYEVLHQDPDLPLVADAIEIENRFQLAPQGRFWADPGLLIEAEIAQQKGGHGEARAVAILEKQAGEALFTLNLPFFWQYGPGYAPGTGFGYSARAEYLLHPLFSPAVEFFGEAGVIGNFPDTAEQEHSAGPAFYGEVRWGGKQKLKYSAATLFGLTEASSDWTLVTRLEYEF